jgi:septation ring formation regulator EzrA
MAVTRINPQEIESSGAQADAAKRKVASAHKDVDEIHRVLDGNIKARNNIDTRLDSIASTLMDVESKIQRIKTVTEKAAINYQRTDNHVELSAKAFTHALNDVGASAMPSTATILTKYDGSSTDRKIESLQPDDASAHFGEDKTRKNE